MSGSSNVGRTATAVPVVSEVTRAPSMPFLQRKCDCGASAGVSGTCAECDATQRYGDVQTKLAVSTPGDRWEQEADRVADAVMRMPEPGAAQGDGEAAGVVQRAAASGENDEEEIQAKRAPGVVGTPPGAAIAGVRPLLGAEASGGRPLSETARADLEPRFGRDFASVRVHADARAAELSQRIGARAFTHGSHIFFGSGQFAPESPSGRRLLAHELTHTVQQRGAPASKNEVDE